MWRTFSRLLAACFFLFFGWHVHADNNQVYNPAWADSVLVNRSDSAVIAGLKKQLRIGDDKTPAFSLQPLKQPAAPAFYAIFFGVILLLAMFLRLLFDDFSESMLNGVLSSKAYYFFLRTNKYDSPVPLAYIFVARSLVFSVLAFLALKKMDPSGIGGFKSDILMRVMITVMLFSIIRLFLELLINWVVGTSALYKAFTLQLLFIDFAWGLLLLAACLVCIYNPGFSMHAPLAWFMSIIGLHMVFNTFRSYQLMTNVRIKYRLHFFLYLCCLKILPVLILAKYLLSNV
jgi:hypothetical protein